MSRVKVQDIAYAVEQSLSNHEACEVVGGGVAVGIGVPAYPYGYGYTTPVVPSYGYDCYTPSYNYTPGFYFNYSKTNRSWSNGHNHNHDWDHNHNHGRRMSRGRRW